MRWGLGSQTHRKITGASIRELDDDTLVGVVAGAVPVDGGAVAVLEGGRETLDQVALAAAAQVM
jgi:hypothetical protein